MYVPKRFRHFVKEPQKKSKHINGNNEQKINKVRDSCRNWIMGILFSFLPLFVLPIADLFVNENNINVFWKVFTNYEVIFIGISSIVSFMNDFSDNTSDRFKSNFTCINILLLVFGSLIYSVRILLDSDLISKNIDSKIAFEFNICYLVIIFLLGFSVYLKGFLED